MEENELKNQLRDLLILEGDNPNDDNFERNLDNLVSLIKMGSYKNE